MSVMKPHQPLRSCSVWTLARLEALQALVDEQAEDAGLWCHAETATEKYIQAALRRLHAAIEAES